MTDKTKRTDNMKEKIGEIKSLISHDLCINRVPRKTLLWFKEYAREEFESDYGMLLRELVQFYRGMYAETMLSGVNLLNEKMDKITEMLQAKEEKEDKPTTTRKMADGTEHEVNRLK